MGSFTRLTYHIVFATKYRWPVIETRFQDRLYDYLGGLLRERKGHAIEIGGVADHVHVLTGLSPTLAVSDVIRDLKAHSSRWVTDTLLVDEFQWQTGFGAFTVSYDKIPSVRNYISNQAEHHRTRTFQEEYIDFLKRHGLTFRMEHLFEDEHIG